MRTYRSISIVLFALMIFSMVLAACSALATPAAPNTPEPQGARLRIRNTSEHDMINFVVMFPDTRLEFGDIPAGATSEYLDAPNGVYAYAAYEYDLNGEKQIQYVIDWVGEEPDLQGDFTYVLTFDPERSQGMAIQPIETIAE